MALTGGCLCGGVRFRIDAPLVSSSWCHCTRCQRRTGTAASANGATVPGSLHVEQGEELLGAFVPSDDGWAKVFCTACGAPLWSEARDGSGKRGVRLGAIDGDPGVRPSARQYVDYAAVWDTIPDDGLPRFPERRPG